jgi:hypothetical protein
LDESTDTRAVCAFFSGAFKQLLAWLIQTSGNKVLPNLSSGFLSAFLTTRLKRSFHTVYHRKLSVPRQTLYEVKYWNGFACTDYGTNGSGKTLFFFTTFRLSTLPCFTSASANTKTKCTSPSSSAERAKSKERSGRT